MDPASSLEISDASYKWIHVLFKGHKGESDSYEAEFRRNNLTAIVVPILDFDYTNLNQLGCFIAEGLATGHEDSGLILTSPRAVESVRQALDQLNLETRSEFVTRVDGDLIFVVGQKTAEVCVSKLKINCNQSSMTSGTGDKLAIFIGNHLRCRDSPVNLIYPKSSLVDNKIEDYLRGEQNIRLKSLVTYETRPIDDVDSALVQRLLELDSLDKSKRCCLNLVFFSPSGLTGFSEPCRARLDQVLADRFPGVEFEFRFSSIGPSTRRALLRRGHDVYVVADEPNASALCRSILGRGAA